MMDKDLTVEANDTASEVAYKTKELLKKQGTVSPDLTKMVSARINRNTVVYAKTPEKLEMALKRFRQ